MKRPLALLLAIVMMVAFVPVFGVTASAANPTTTYSIYTQNFEGLDTGLDTAAIWTNLGWYVPDSKTDNGMAKYSITGTTNRALRVDTTNYPQGMEQDSFVTVFGGDVMSVVREGDFTLSYSLTYRTGTTNYNGYAALLYNYNGENGNAETADDPSECYGLVALRPNGTGTNSLYYPAKGYTSSLVLLEDKQNAAANVLSNRYTAGGSYPSVYARLFSASESTTTTRKNTSVFVNKTINIRIEYKYNSGISVYANGGSGEILVSSTCTKSYDSVNNPYTWQNFLTRNAGGAIALLVQPGIVVDIDNISLKTSSYGGAHSSENLPDLLITEVSGTGPADSVNHHVLEYIEIYNPTDHEIDLCNYSLMYSEGVEEAGVTGSIGSTGNYVKFGGYVKFDDLLGKKVTSSATFYVLKSKLATMTEGVHFKYYDTKSYNGNKQVDENGTYRRINYIESWNTRYDKNSTQASTNTKLQPGETAVLFILEDGREGGWQYGVNALQYNTTTFSTERSFRSVCSAYGLNAGTKVIAVDTYVSNNNKFSLYDSVNRYYYIGKAYDSSNKAINYSTLYTTNLPNVVSYVQYSTPMISGNRYEGRDPDSSSFGNAGLSEKNTCAHYVYGLDASSDYRRGLMYNGHVSVTSCKSIGSLMGYQQVIFENIANRRNGAKAPLSITEIVPRTNDLAGEENNVFSAMEVTNTSASAVNLYDYVLTRTALDSACKFVAPNSAVKDQFNRVNYLQGGNPVTKGAGNSAYYYFMEEHISNPKTCVVQPGETVVLWFLTTETYTVYGGDDDFGVDYFRQYWLDNGCGQLAEKVNGTYATKVIAVDAHTGTTFNPDHADHLFQISSTGSGVYGIAPKTAVTESYTVDPSAVISLAVIPLVSLYFDITPGWYATLDGDLYYGNVLTYSKLPVNTSIRYVAGSGPETGACKLADSVKVGTYIYDKNKEVKLTEETINKGLVLSYSTSNPLRTPDLGRLSGKEYYAVPQTSIFLKTTDSSNNSIYYYYDIVRVTGVHTLAGAALSTSGTAALRFDTAVSTAYYDTLAATYGSNVRTGAVIVRADQAAKLRELTKEEITLDALQEQLSRDNITAEVSKAVAIARSNGFVILGASCEVAPADYGTSFAAMGFLEVTLPNGTVRTFWSGTTATGNVKQVAIKALSDTSTAQTEQYRYLRSGTTGIYSPYNVTMQEALAAYSDS